MASRSQTADPTRLALAEAIAAYGEARDAALSCRAAVERAETNLYASSKRLTNATEALEQAREAQTAGLIDAAKGNREPPSRNALRAARQAEAEAQDEIEAAKSALTALNAELAEAERRQQRSKANLDAAAIEVLAAAAPDLMQAAHDAHRQSLRFHHALHVILEGLTGPPSDERKMRISRVIDDRSIPGAPPFDRNAARAPWLAALEDLKRDANAPLPSIS